MQNGQYEKWKRFTQHKKSNLLIHRCTKNRFKKRNAFVLVILPHHLAVDLSTTHFFKYNRCNIRAFKNYFTTLNSNWLREPGVIESREKDDGHQQQVLVNVILFNSHCKKKQAGTARSWGGCNLHIIKKLLTNYFNKNHISIKFGITGQHNNHLSCDSNGPSKASNSLRVQSFLKIGFPFPMVLAIILELFELGIKTNFTVGLNKDIPDITLVSNISCWRKDLHLHLPWRIVIGVWTHMFFLFD